MKSSSRVQKKWKREYESLKRRHDHLWKEIFDSNNVFEDTNVQILTKELRKNTNLVSNELSCHVNQLRKSNGQMKVLLVHPSIEEDAKYLDELTDALEDLDDEIRFTRAVWSKQLCDLALEEESLEKDCIEIQQRLRDRVDDVSSVDAPLQRVKSFRSKDSRPPEIIEIEKQIDALGPLGGWNAEDHDVFLKYYVQVRSAAQLCSKCQDVIQKTDDEITEHLKWYENILDLKDRRRELIAQYTRQKKLAALMEMEEAKSEESEIERRPKTRSKVDKERKQRFERLNIWKEERRRQEEARAIEERKRKEKKRQAALRKRNREKREQELKKEQLEVYRFTKKLREEQEKLETGPSAAVNIEEEAEKRRRIKKRNKEMLAKAKERRKSSQKAEMEREAKLKELAEKSKPNFEVQGKRLNRHTLTSRLRENGGADAREDAQKPKSRFERPTCNQVVRRQTPSWRRGL